MPGGAEMLILQQTIRHYIELSRSRPLAHHERTELKRLMADLAPALKRYQEGPSLTQPAVPTGSSLVAVASQEVNRPLESNSTLVAAPPSAIATTAKTTRKPNVSGISKPVRVKKEDSVLVSTRPELAHSTITAAVVRPKTITILGAKSTNRQSLDPQLGLVPTKPPTASLGVKTNRLADVTNNNKSKAMSDKKNHPPKRKVLGNATNTLNTPHTTNTTRTTNTTNTTKTDNRPLATRDDIKKRDKRTRTHEDDESDNDDYKENVDPRRPFSSRRRTTAQGNAVAVIRPHITPRPMLSNSRDNIINIISGGNYPESRETYDHNLGRSSPGAYIHQSPGSRVSSGATNINAMDSTFAGNLRLSSVIQGGLSNIQSKAVSASNKHALSQDTHNHLPHQTQEPNLSNTPRHGSRGLDHDLHSPIEVPASVDDDESVKSFGDLRALTPEYPVALDHPKVSVTLAAIAEIPEIPDYEEVPDSQCYQNSQSSQGSMEATLAMPMFLQNSLPEAEDESLPSADGSNQNNETPMESTKLVDGVWCFDEFKDTIMGTVCSNHNQWIAVETKSRVQLWQLVDEMSRTECKWARRFQLDKLSSATRVMFAPDDSASVIVNMIDNTIVCVPLTGLDTEGDQKDLTSAVSRDTTWSQHCNSFITAGQNNSFFIVAGSTAVGSVCLVEISTSQHSVPPFTSRTLCCASVSEVASSVVPVQNSASLILAAFGETIVLWDLMRCDEPGVLIDVAEALSSINLSRLCPTLVTATVPEMFLKTYNGGSDQSSTALPASQWPIFVTIGVKSGTTYHFENEYDQCAHFLLNGSKIELMHTYYGTKSISSAFASSRFLACQTTAQDGKSASLQLWDLCSPESIATLALVTSADQQDTLTQEPRRRQRSPLCNNNQALDLLSSGSSLSPPPPSSSSSLSSDEDEDVDQGHGRQWRVNVSVRPNEVSRSNSVPVRAESMNLRSVAFLDRAAEVQFALHAQHRWAVVVKRAHNVSTMHVVDFGSMLY